MRISSILLKINLKKDLISKMWLVFNDIDTVLPELGWLLSFDDWSRRICTYYVFFFFGVLVICREMHVAQCWFTWPSIWYIIRIHWKLLSGLNRQSEIWKHKQIKYKNDFCRENYSIIQSYAKQSLCGHCLYISLIYNT